MAVRATRSITEGADTFQIEHTFECGQFDLIQENNPGIWTEIWRDCDLSTKNRRRLTPYASGLKGMVDVEVIIPPRARHWKYFPASGDDFTDELDLSDVNDGILPQDFCRWMEIYQNGKKLPCHAYEIDFSTSTVTIETDWLVPGAAYEVVFWASPSGGSSTPGT